MTYTGIPCTYSPFLAIIDYCMNMERRQFLRYASLSTVGFAFTACNSGSNPKTQESLTGKSAVNFGNLEKTDLTIGIVPVLDCAPLVVAKEKGLFQKYGLNVTLKQESSWIKIQDGLVKGRLDAAHALYGMPMFTQLGANKAPMVSLMTLNLNGNAIAHSKKAWEAGIRPSIDYTNFQEFIDTYKKYIQSLKKRPSFGIEFPAAMQNYTLRYWLSAMGVQPDEDIKLIEILPTQIVDKFKAGVVDGYCASAPWNQQAVLDKVGFTSFVDRDIWQGHPEKVLATMEKWVQDNPTTARAVVAAVLEACQYCDRPQNSLEVATLIADQKYVNTQVKSLQDALSGNYNYGGFDQTVRVKQIPDLQLFHFKNMQYLKPPDHANYPWRSHAVWVLTQMIRWNQIEAKQYPKDADTMIDKIYPLEIYEEVAKALKIPLPKEQMKVEPAAVFIDGWAFDPSQPVQYLNQFEIRAGRQQILALS